MSFSRGALFAAIVAGAFAAIAVQPAAAQFDPPSTIFGSVTDSAGPVPEGLPVEAYIGDTLCGKDGKTEYTGDGPARVTVYVVDVVADSQIRGCGRAGAEVRIKIGDRFAPQVARWQAGPVQLDVTFGSATPAPIPTFTPTPTRTPEPNATPAPGQSTPGANGTPGQGGAVATIPAGSPGAGSPVTGGGVTSATPGQQNSSGGDGGGFPVWGVIVLVLGAIAAIGGGAGYILARNRQSDSDDLPPPGGLE